MKILLVAVLLLVTNPVAALTCSCGPDFCLNDSRYPSALEDKKATLRKSYPERLVALLDRDGKCIARVERAPNGFSIMEHGSDGSILVYTWSKQAEEAVRRAVQDGRLGAFYLFNVRHLFSCCNEADYSDRPDYNSELDLNTSLVIKCDKSSISKQACGA